MNSYEIEKTFPATQYLLSIYRRQTIVTSDSSHVAIALATELSWRNGYVHASKRFRSSLRFCSWNYSKQLGATAK